MATLKKTHNTFIQMGLDRGDEQLGRTVITSHFKPKNEKSECPKFVAF